MTTSLATGVGTRPFDQMPPELVPMIVCLTFSVELYLKCLVLLETGAPPRGHNLEELMALVTQTRQDEIEHHYEAFMAQSPNKAPMEASKSPGFGVGSTKFRAALRVASDGFVNWRYVYERNMQVGPNAAMYIAYTVRRTIIELRPDWESLLVGLHLPPTSATT